MLMAICSFGCNRSSEGSFGGRPPLDADWHVMRIGRLNAHAVLWPPNLREWILSFMRKIRGFRGRNLERVAGIEPAHRAWEASRLPLHHTRPVAPY